MLIFTYFINTKLLLVICSFLFFLQCYASSFDDFAPFQYQLSREYVLRKIVLYLQGSEEIEEYYAHNEEAFFLFASPQDKEQNHPEYTLFFKPPDKDCTLPSCMSQTQDVKELSQVKIAIDPGHFGGQYARLEKRYVYIEHGENKLSFDEGTLAFLTALHLKKRLEERGVSVLLTRQMIGKGAYREDFFDWLRQHPEYWETKEILPTIFRSYYNVIDLRERARMINEYHPDLTIIIHYNACNSDSVYFPQRTQITDRNFNLVFIPGAFFKEELTTVEDRYHFLRFICTQDLENSYHIAHKLMENFTLRLKVPPFSLSQNCRSGFSGYSLMLEDGIFSRNLCLTRLVQGALCYGESLIQNNLKEALALSKNEVVVDGIPCPKRVIDVAEAYLEAILSYFNAKTDK